MSRRRVSRRRARCLGLTNDTTYNFTVRAINEVGESDPSGASIDARPDVKPEQPEAPTAVRGDQKLDVSWEAPVNKGSAIETYVLQISPPAPDGTGQQEIAGGTTSFTWDGLANGTEYRFSVQAVNRADEPSEFSPESRGTIPAGKPTEPTNVTASATQLGGSTQSGDRLLGKVERQRRRHRALHGDGHARTERLSTVSRH